MSLNNDADDEALERIYLDVCVLCRQFDDQRQKRIREETDALATIIEAVNRSQYALIVSPAHQMEIGKITSVQKRRDLMTMLQVGTRIVYDDLVAIRSRVKTLTHSGMGVADATHVAFAEASEAQFITVDDRLLKQCARLPILVSYDTPLSFCDKENLQ